MSPEIMLYVVLFVVFAVGIVFGVIGMSIAVSKWWNDREAELKDVQHNLEFDLANAEEVVDQTRSQVPFAI